MTPEIEEMWKRRVMREYQAVAKELMAEYQQRYPLQSLWSFTLSDTSDRLMQQTPGVRLKDGLAFIFGGAK